MEKDCRAWARTCLDCQRSKVSRHVHSPLGAFQTPTNRFSHIHIDIIGPFPPLQSFRYCLTVVDRFTRWPEVCPMKDSARETVIQALLACWISRFGFPQVITSDRGAQFTSHYFRDFVKFFGVKHNFTNSWHPSSNGLVERFHRQLKAAIMSHSCSNWALSLPLILLGIRSSFKEDLKTSSAELVYGETLRLPGEFFRYDPLNSQQCDPHFILYNLRNIMTHLKPVPTSAHGTPALFLHKDLKDCTHVFLKEGGFLKSLQPPYTGPHEVIKRDEKTFTLKIRGKPQAVSIDRVKPAYVFSSTSAISKQVGEHQSKHVHFEDDAYDTAPGDGVANVRRSQPRSVRSADEEEKANE
uniref:Integrase catalytic domain-containing protein n=1 Tax=Trichogramma kaykai TaxID=54128 RepID=A0ABD2WD90_9HYME